MSDTEVARFLVSARARAQRVEMIAAFRAPHPKPSCKPRHRKSIRQQIVAAWVRR